MWLIDWQVGCGLGCVSQDVHVFAGSWGVRGLGWVKCLGKLLIGNLLAMAVKCALDLP